MEFKGWLLLNENIEANFDNWLRAIQNYAKPQEKEWLKAIGIFQPQDDKYPNRGDIVHEFNGRLKNWQDIIIKVLKIKNVENLNWLAFSIGYLIVKSFAQEDLELAIDVTKRRIDSGELPKSEIGLKGWMQIGKEALDSVRKYLADQQELSNRQKLKLKKSGETLEDDDDLIKLIAKEEDYTLYYLPGLNTHPDHSADVIYSQIIGMKNKIESRKRLLCKYGKGTDWCTANPTGNYDTYYMNNDIYIMHEKGNPKYQFTSCEDSPRAGASASQFMDVKDNSVNKITQEEKQFLDKYAKKAYKCYSMKIIFNNLKSYLNSSSEDKEKISMQSVVELTGDRDFKNLSKEDANIFFEMINSSGVDGRSDLHAESWLKVLNNITEEQLNNYIRDKTLADIIIRIQHYDYDTLIKKLSKERFEEFLDLNMNDVYDYEKDHPLYVKEAQNSRKKTIRNLLNMGYNISNSLKTLDFIRKKANIGLPEAYTIFDTIISKIKQASEEGLLSTPTIMSSLDKFAKIFGKENINRIDLDRLQDRMKIELIPIGNGTYKVKVDTSQNLNSLKNLMIRFLVRYHDKIVGTDKAQDWFT